MSLTILKAEVEPIQIRVEGRAAPKGSRIAQYTRAGQLYTRPASKYEQPWIEAVRAATREAMRHHAQWPPPYVLDVEILVQRTRTHKYEHPSGHDLDKLARAVIDGLVQGNAITDDRHVVELHARKRYTEGDEPPGAIVHVSPG